MPGAYAADGSLNVTVVSGSALTGLYAADGSLNVVLAPSPVTAFKGAYHPCGAWYVTLVTSGVCGYYAADGTMNVAQTPFTAKGAVRVTAVSGSLSGGGGGSAGSPLGLLLALTSS